MAGVGDYRGASAYSREPRRRCNLVENPGHFRVMAGSLPLLLVEAIAVAEMAEAGGFGRTERRKTPSWCRSAMFSNWGAA
jgi:hypothetical protein